MNKRKKNNKNDANNQTLMGYNKKQNNESQRNDQNVQDSTLALPTLFNKMGNTFSSSIQKSNLEKMKLTNTIK